MKDVMLIGIAGGSGSGKSTLAAHLAERFGSEVAIIRHDNYYRRRDDMTFEERCLVNYDEPAAFDSDLMLHDLVCLKTGIPVDTPVYDFSIHNRSDEKVRVEPKRVIIVEGILVFADDRISDLFDIKIFVDTDADVRILRRLLRDVKERGRSMESVITQYLTTVKPMHERYVEPSKRRADIIVPEGGHNLVALDMIVERIRSHINDE